MELNRKQIKSQARILVQNKWGSLFVITFVVMMLTGMGMFNNCLLYTSDAADEL